MMAGGISLGAFAPSPFQGVTAVTFGRDNSTQIWRTREMFQGGTSMTTNPLPFSARLAVYRRALEDEAFLERAKADPRAAIAEVSGITLPATVDVTPLVDKSDEMVVWLPAPGTDVAAPANAARPMPGVERDVFDAYLLNALAIDPGLRQRIRADVKGEMLRTIGFSFVGKVTLAEEADSQVLLMLPAAAVGDELDDSLLDMVSGGSMQTCEGPNGCDK